MNLRIRLIITSVLLCHCFLAAQTVTSQLQPPGTAFPEAEICTQAESRTVLKSGETVVIKSCEQEKVGAVYTLRRRVEITFRAYVFRADLVKYNSDTGIVEAEGHVVFDGGPHDEHLTATRGTYDINSENGHFWNVVGTTGAKFKGKAVILTSSEPFLFSGKEVEKIGRDRIVVHYGTATTCHLPHPKWTFNAQRMDVVAGKDAKIYHSSFRFFGIPIFYFPFLDHPVERLPRKSGILIPTVGQSSRKGLIVGDSVFWAINRSADATLGAEYFAKRGWSQHAMLRLKPNDTSYFEARYFGVLDRGLLHFGSDGSVVRENQGGEELRVNGETWLPHQIRGVANVDYLSSFVFRLAFSETYSEAINSEVKSNAFLFKNWRGLALGTDVARYQNFECSNVVTGNFITGVVSCSVITIVHAPTFEASTVDRKLGNSPVYFRFDAATDGVSRREPGFVTPKVVGRFDLAPEFTMPLRWHGWDLRPTVALRNTYYTESLTAGTGIGTGVLNQTGVNRKAADGEVEFRPPVLSRVFDSTWLHHNFKHAFEPRVVYRRVAGVDNFSDIIRFDQRDILSDTNEVELGFTNRLYSKRVPKDVPSCTGDRSGWTEERRRKCDESRAREIVTWEVRQKYFFDPTFGGALVSGRRNVFTTTADFTGIAFLTEPRNWSPVVSRLRVRSASRTDFEWHFDYDPRKGYISSSMAFVNYQVSKDLVLGGGHAFLRSPGDIVTSPGQVLLPPTTFNQYRLIAQYGRPNRIGPNLAITTGYDLQSHFMQYAASQLTYNWDCCGLSFEYRRFAIPAVRNENQFRFALTLANVGTFGTLRKQERLF